MKSAFTIILIILATTLFGQKRINKEVHYQYYFADSVKAQTEVVLKSKARVDIVTDLYAIEVDFANKWAEGIGQSLYYALETNKIPGILLIMENPKKDQRYLNRLLKVTKELRISVWTIDVDCNVKLIMDAY